MTNRDHQLTIDVTEGFFGRSVLAELEYLDITFEVVSWNGPAGGAPVVRLYGTKTAIEGYISTYYSSDPDDYDFYVDLIEPRN